MKYLKEYIKEGLFDNIDKLEGKNGLESNSKQLKKEIVDWICSHYFDSPSFAKSRAIKKSALTVNTSTTPPTVNYNGQGRSPCIYITTNTDSLCNNGMFQWGEFEGCFDCSYCKSLTTLEGAPEKVGGDFKCNGCKLLKTLEGAPEKVGWSFSCTECHSLTSLKGAPKEINMSFYCNYCKSLKTLEGAPEEIGGFFNCMDCPKLTSLKGAPKKVGSFRVGPWLDPNCSLTSLEGGPKEVREDFNCSLCNSLKTLEGGPKVVGGDFKCYSCGTKFTEEDVKKVSNVKRKIYC